MYFLLTYTLILLSPLFGYCMDAPQDGKQIQEDDKFWNTRKYNISTKVESNGAILEECKEGNYISGEAVKTLNRDNFYEIENGSPNKFRSQARTKSRECLLEEHDRRSPITPTYSYPDCCYGNIIATFEGGTVRGTGVLIGPKHILLAAHLVFLTGRGGWAKSINFYPARDGEKTLLYKNGAKISYTGIELICFEGWVAKLGRDGKKARLTESQKEIRRTFDIAMVILDKEIGKDIGWVGLFAPPASLLLGKKVDLRGYPAKKDGDKMWTMRGPVTKVDAESFQYDIDSGEGQSGSGTGAKWPGIKGYLISGIHTYGYEEEKDSKNQNAGGQKTFKNNIATRLSARKLGTILGWMKGYEHEPELKEYKLPNQNDSLSSEDGANDNARGVCYHDYRGKRQNYKKAKKIYKKAEKKGCPAASRNLGHMYYFGEGVKQDYNQALEYLCIAFNRKYHESFVLNALIQIFLCASSKYKTKILSNLPSNWSTYLPNWLEPVIIEIYEKLPEQEKIKGYRLLSYLAYRKKAHTSRSNIEYKKWEERAIDYFKKARESSYELLSYRKYGERGGATADFAQTLQLYFAYRNDFLEYPSLQTGGGEMLEGGTIRVSHLSHTNKENNAESSDGPREGAHNKNISIRNSFEKYLHAQLKFHQLNMVEFGATLYVPYVDENGFVWLFISEDKGKNWRRYLPAESVDMEWIATIEGFSFPTNNPVQMVVCDNRWLCCAFVTTDQSINITYSENGRKWEKIVGLKHELGSEKITQLKLININDIPYAFWLGGNELNLWYESVLQRKVADNISASEGSKIETKYMPWLPIEAAQGASSVDVIRYQNETYAVYFKEEDSITVGILDPQQIIFITKFSIPYKETGKCGLTFFANLIGMREGLYLRCTDQKAINTYFYIDHNNSQCCEVVNIEDFFAGKYEK